MQSSPAAIRARRLGLHCFVETCELPGVDPSILTYGQPVDQPQGSASMLWACIDGLEASKGTLHGGELFAGFDGRGGVVRTQSALRSPKINLSKQNQ
jgi:hypothetical protein